MLVKVLLGFGSFKNGLLRLLAVLAAPGAWDVMAENQLRLEKQCVDQEASSNLCIKEELFLDVSNIYSSLLRPALSDVFSFDFHDVSGDRHRKGSAKRCRLRGIAPSLGHEGKAKCIGLRTSARAVSFMQSRTAQLVSYS